MSQSLQFQQDVADRLASIDYFDNLQIVLEADGVTVEEVEEAIAQSVLGDLGDCQPGTYILVGETTNAGEGKTPDVPGPQYRFQLSISIFQRPKQFALLDDPKKDFHDIEEFTGQCFHQWQIGTTVVTYLGTTTENDGKGLLKKVVRLGWNPPGLKRAECVKPTISLEDDGGINVACNTPGAAVFVSLDGSLPLPSAENATPTLQKAAPGDLVRAVAYAPRCLPSGVAELIRPVVV